jgi:hypothetical protein
MRCQLPRDRTGFFRDSHAGYDPIAGEPFPPGNGKGREDTREFCSITPAGGTETPVRVTEFEPAAAVKL